MSSTWSRVTLADILDAADKIPDYPSYEDAHTPLTVGEARLYASKFGISPLSEIEGRMLYGDPIRVIHHINSDGSVRYPHDWKAT
jgi:hypothetical protein